MNAANSYVLMWQHIASELYELASDKYNEDLPQLKLIVAVITQAAKDYDRDYLNSPTYVEHVNLLRIHVKVVTNIIVSAWSIIDSREVWKPTEPVSEEWDI